MAYNRNNTRGGSQTPPRRQGLNVSAQSLSAMPRSPSEALEPSRGPEPPQKRKPKKQLHPFFAFINGLITFFLVGTVGLILIVYLFQHQFTRSGPLNYSTVVVIPKGTGTTKIADKLQNEGIINHKLIFMLSWYFVHEKPTLKAGEYAIPEGASVNNVIEKLTKGQGIFHKITIPEGFTSEQVVNRINTHPKLKGIVTEIPPEGSLLPDTYTYSRNTDRNDIIKRMQAEQRKFVSRVWKRRAENLPVKSAAEALILASIVEKESGRSDERARVAGVFVNRLRRGMKLQSDPTIIYGLVGGKGTLGRPIYRSEIRSKTPFNTYYIKGLPPTPIANPGRAAIEAVLNPANTNDLYFVANGTGGHAFAPTLKQHNENVKKWRVIEKEIRKRQAAKKAKRLAEQAAQGQQQNNNNISGITVTGSQINNISNQKNNIYIPLPERRE